MEKKRKANENLHYVEAPTATQSPLRCSVTQIESWRTHKTLDKQEGDFTQEALASDEEVIMQLTDELIQMQQDLENTRAMLDEERYASALVDVLQRGHDESAFNRLHEQLIQAESLIAEACSAFAPIVDQLNEGASVILSVGGESAENLQIVHELSCSYIDNYHSQSIERSTEAS